VPDRSAGALDPCTTIIRPARKQKRKQHRDQGRHGAIVAGLHGN